MKKVISIAVNMRKRSTILKWRRIETATTEDLTDHNRETTGTSIADLNMKK